MPGLCASKFRTIVWARWSMSFCCFSDFKLGSAGIRRSVPSSSASLGDVPQNLVLFLPDVPSPRLSALVTGDTSKASPILWFFCCEVATSEASLASRLRRRRRKCPSVPRGTSMRSL